MESPGYYEAIARHYDEIFPINPVAVALMKELAGPSPTHILDIACGNAAYATALSSDGYLVEGVDLDAGMIQAAQGKKLLQKKREPDAANVGRESESLARENVQPETDNPRLLQGDMLHLDLLGLTSPQFAYCIGNSLVHLSDYRQVGAFLKQAYNLLQPNGHLLIQILNYNRILHDHVMKLPDIRRADGSLLFERFYEYDLPGGASHTPHADTAPETSASKASGTGLSAPETSASKAPDTGPSAPEPSASKAPDTEPSDATVPVRIRFHTRLHAEGSILESTIPLIALDSETLESLLEAAGFQHVILYGDFKRTTYDPATSYALVVTAMKQSVILL
jgi:SAM-dependent methyltransferase